MELAGLKVVMDADFSAVDKAFTRANTLLNNFKSSINGIYKSMPDLGKKINVNIGNISAETSNILALADVKKLEAQARQATAKAILDEEKARKLVEPKVSKQLDEYGQLVKESNDLVRAYYNASASVLKYGDSAGITADKLEEMRLKALEGQQVLQKIEQGAGRFQRNVGNYASGFNPINNAINQLTREAPAFANSLQTGFMAISNNIAPLSDAIGQARAKNLELTASGKAGIPIWKQLTSSLFSWQTLMMAGVTVLTMYGDEIIDWIAGTKEAKKEQELLNKEKERSISINDSANKSIAENISKIRILQATIESETSSHQEKLKALKAIQAVYPDRLKNLDLDKAKTGELATIINNELVPALLNQGKAMVLYEQIQDEVRNIVELERERDRVAKEQEEQVKRATSANEDYAKSLQSISDAPNFAQGAPNTNFEDPLSTDGTEIGRLDKSIQERTDKLNDLLKSHNELTNATKGLNTESLNQTETNKKNTKELKTLADAEKEYNDAIDLTKRKQELALYADKKEMLEEQIKAVEAFILNATSNDIIDPLGLDSDEIRFQTFLLNGLKEGVKNFELEVERVKKQMEAWNKVENFFKSNTGLLKARKDELTGIAGELHNISVLQKEGLMTYEQGNIKTLEALNKEFERLILLGDYVNAKEIEIIINSTKARTELDAINGKFRDLIENTLPAFAEALGEGIGDAINGGGIEGIFESLGASLGSQIASLGKLLIQAGLTMEVIEKAIQALGLPGGGIGLVIAGVASVAVGKALQTSLSKKKSTVGSNFASGGIVYGETYARVGEYSNARSNPEVIAPLDKLRNILGDSVGSNERIPYIAETRINGQDLLLAVKRADKNFNR